MTERRLPLHIAMVTPEYPTGVHHDGGLANYTRRIARELVKRGHSVTVFVVSHRRHSWIDGTVRIVEVPGRRLSLARSIPFLGNYAAIVERLRTAKILEREMTSMTEQIDVVQTPSYGYPMLRLGKRSEIPAICRISSYSPDLRAAFGQKTKLPERLSDMLETRQTIQAAKTFSPSRFVANLYEERVGLRPIVIPTPPPAHTPISVTEKPLAVNRPYLLFAGTLSRVKGVDVLAAALPDTLARHPEIDIVFIGRDDGLPSGETMRSYIRTVCKHFTDRIHIFPPIEHMDLLHYMQHALGVVLPSRIDNCPNVCLEAQAMGLPVVGTNNSSLEELITHRKQGFLAANGDVASLERCLNQLLDLSEAERAAMVAATHSLHQKRLQADPVGQLEELYYSAVKRG